MFNFSVFESKRCALCSVFDQKTTNYSNSDFAFAVMLMMFTYISFCRSFDNISLKKKKINSQLKKKIIISIEKILKIVSLISETLSFVSENSVAVIEFSNSIMFDALKRFDSSFVDFSKRQVFSFFVVFSFFSCHRNESSSLIAFLSLELICINRKFAHFKEKMYSNFSAFEKKIAKIATNVIQLSIVFDDLKRTMKMLKNRLLTMKKLIKKERMSALFSEIDSERKMFVFRVEIADERVITIESDHENQKNKFFNRSRKINRID